LWTITRRSRQTKERERMPLIKKPATDGSAPGASFWD
jgi:hypothetical protein